MYISSIRSYLFLKVPYQDLKRGMEQGGHKILPWMQIWSAMNMARGEKAGKSVFLHRINVKFCKDWHLGQLI